MNIKYILHGGLPHRPNPENNKFYKEVLNNEIRNLRVLLVYFAETEERIQHCKEQDISHFNNNRGTKELTYEIAEEKSFSEQVKRSDIIYIRGGDTLKLIGILHQFPDATSLFDGKTVAAESAGVYALSACFYSKTAGGVFKGLGLVPVKTICHYVGKNKDKLEECSQDLEYLLLSSYTFKVFNISHSSVLKN